MQLFVTSRQNSKLIRFLHYARKKNSVGIEIYFDTTDGKYYQLNRTQCSVENDSFYPIQSAHNAEKKE
jgi:hypothetical protein